jgi:hypothetical protein
VGEKEKAMRKILLLALLISSGPVLAEGRSDKSAGKGNKGKVTCIENPETGSRLSRKRVCKTAEQWEQDRQDAKDMLDRSNRAQTNPVG